MKKNKEGNKLRAEELERRMAPGRLGHIEPPEQPADPGGGGSMPVPGDPQPVARQQPGRVSSQRQKLFNQD